MGCLGLMGCGLIYLIAGACTGIGRWYAAKVALYDKDKR